MGQRWTIRLTVGALWLATALGVQAQNDDVPHVHVGEFLQDVAKQYGEADGLPGGEAAAIEATGFGLFAGTGSGVYQWADDAWQPVEALPSRSVQALAAQGGVLYAAISGTLYSWQAGEAQALGSNTEVDVHDMAADDQAVWIATNEGLGQYANGQLAWVDSLPGNAGGELSIYCLAVDGEGRLAVGANRGLYLKDANGSWDALYPYDERGRSWAPRGVGSVAFDEDGALWFGSPQGVGRWQDGWTLFTGDEGLPWNQFTAMDTGGGEVVFGTTMGVVGYADGEWEYRQGPRWTPDDQIDDIVLHQGDIWVATPNGIGVIERVPMTLAEKAEFYEEETENKIKRTEYGYVSEERLVEPGDKSEIIHTDSDNDGLWTSMYGAGACYAYAATGDPEAKRRAKEAFEALRFLSEAPAQGVIEQQPGFVARTVIPTTEPDPNERSSYTLEGMKHRKATDDALWKIIYPRYIKTEDGKYWYKNDTSSDELDGHFYFYPLYYDLVAETEEEKERVREVVRSIIDHLIRNDFTLVDHDGEPTRWAIYSPDLLNHDPHWYNERGLKSLSILSYLAVARHITGDETYDDIAMELREAHAFDTNAMIAKIHNGIGSGNQSDDEMAIMGFYNLLKYTNDEELRDEMLYSFYKYWIREAPEMNPFFNFAYAVHALGESHENQYGEYPLEPWDGWLQDSVDTLVNFPLDRINWPHQNSHRLDVVMPEPQAGRDPYDPSAGRGYRVNGKVLPIENRHFNHWNTDPWRLDYGGDGRTLGSGGVYLLPYYMGLYYGFIVED